MTTTIEKALAWEIAAAWVDEVREEPSVEMGQAVREHLREVSRSLRQRAAIIRRRKRRV